MGGGRPRREEIEHTLELDCAKSEATGERSLLRPRTGTNGCKASYEAINDAHMNHSLHDADLRKRKKNMFTDIFHMFQIAKCRSLELV